MRLTEKEITAFIDAINANITLHQSELKLYGSRVKDESKGGDIDLLLIVPEPIFRTLLAKKIDILVDIKAKIGEQKIDLTLAAREEIEEDPFLKIIHKDAILLYRWD